MKSERTIDYGMTKVQALFCNLVNLVSFFKMKRVNLVIEL